MKPTTDPPADATAQITARIELLDDWRGQTLAEVRRLIRAADPDVVEEVKWRGVPVWSHDGIVCTGETYKLYVKLTFARGAALVDPTKLFNASLDGHARRRSTSARTTGSTRRHLRDWSAPPWPPMPRPSPPGRVRKRGDSV